MDVVKPVFYTAKDISEMFRVHIDTARSWGRSGKFGATKVGRKVLFPADKVDAAIKAGTIADKLND